MNIYYSPDLLFLLFFILSGILIVYAIITACCCQYEEGTVHRNIYTERTHISASNPNFRTQQVPGYYATSSLGIYTNLPETYSAYTQVPNTPQVHQSYPNYQPIVHQVQSTAEQRPPTYQEVTRTATEHLQKQAPYNPYNPYFS
ncbi:uncharacterized protein LOC123299848 [Chrysoperla carnea]|uniref:uncharacterized protein LOC123299848 n=1 Tax=Chrysoperla carnea TaxID=189513 RepID=UPI001D094572|nr:uncharacterized protein LOC123299848 [Chrysoperla carnea]